MLRQDSGNNEPVEDGEKELIPGETRSVASNVANERLGTLTSDQEETDNNPDQINLNSLIVSQIRMFGSGCMTLYCVTVTIAASLGAASVLVEDDNTSNCLSMATIPFLGTSIVIAANKFTSIGFNLFAPDWMRRWQSRDDRLQSVTSPERASILNEDIEQGITNRPT